MVASGLNGDRISRPNPLRVKLPGRKKGKTAAVIRSLFGTYTDHYDMNLLRLPEGSTLTYPMLIYESDAKHREIWH